MMTDWFHRRSLSIVAFGLFLATMVGQLVAGRADYNQEQEDHGQPRVTLLGYVTTGSFVEATMENWESEFLQMSVFIFLTAVLYQKGSAESRKPADEPGADDQAIDEPPERHRNDPDAPWPVRRGGLALALYKRSLSLSLFLLFAVSMVGHAMGGAVDYSEEAVLHGGKPVGTLAYMATSRFWFESFQNWQSEFLSVWAIAVLSIWLRQQGSPESKPVHAPYEQTGAE